LSALEITRPVGSKFEYSNLNYNVLGLIIEAVSGESYEDYIQQHIFDPLAMSHSYTSKADAQQDGLATGHRFWFGVPIAARNLPVPRGSLPAGELISSAEDISHYLIAQLNEGRYGGAQILSGAGIEELHRPAAEINEMGMSLGHYGMGWICEGTGESRIVSHSGIVPDFGGFMALVPEQKKGLVLLYNVNHAMMKMTLDEMGMGAAERLAGRSPAPMRFGAVPWVMRAVLLIPLLQIVGVVATLLRLRQWHHHPEQRPSGARVWGLHILLPLIPNLSLVAFPLLLRAKGMVGFMRFFMPDVAWIALIGGGFAGMWSILRTELLLQARRKNS
jgi:CubicO group peptidase (beta-lactamase class C family)